MVIEGGATNKSFILDLLDQPEVVDGEEGWADTGWIDRVRGEGRLRRRTGTPASPWSRPASRPTRTRSRSRSTRLLETAHGGRPQVQHEVGRAVDLKLRGTSYTGDGAAGRPAPVPGRRSRPARSSTWWTPSRAARRVPHPADGRRRAVPAGDRDPRAGPPRRGRRGHPPGQPGRGRGAALAGPALVVATPVAVGGPVAAGRPRAGAGEHEDGDGAARAVRRPGAASCW